MLSQTRTVDAKEGCPVGGALSSNNWDPVEFCYPALTGRQPDAVLGLLMVQMPFSLLFLHPRLFTLGLKTSAPRMCVYRSLRARPEMVRRRVLGARRCSQHGRFRGQSRGLLKSGVAPLPRPDWSGGGNDATKRFTCFFSLKIFIVDF